jgi:hypothetical protein
MPDLAADVSFTRAFSLNEPPSLELLKERNLFQSGPNTGTLRRLGAAPEDGLVPTFLRPTDIVEQALARTLKREGTAIGGTRLPFKWSLASGTPVSINVAVRLFPPKILVVTVLVRDIVLAEDSLAEQLIAVQVEVPQRITPVVQRALAAMIATGDHRAERAPGVQLEGRTMPATHLRVDVERAAIPQWADQHARALAAAVIRDSDYETTDPALFTELFERNRELNRKGGIRRLLDKQGGLLVSSGIEPRKAAVEFTRLADLETMALVLRQFFAIYSRGRSDAPGFYDFLLAKAMFWVDPDRIGRTEEDRKGALRDSVTSEHAWELLVKQVGLMRDADRLLNQDGVGPRIATVRQRAGALDLKWWENPDLPIALDDLLVEDPPPPPPGGTINQYIQVWNATQLQIAAGDIKNYSTFEDLADTIEDEIDRLIDVGDAAKDEARGLLAKIRGKSDSVATSAAGSAGGAVLGAILKQLLGLP